MEELKAFEPKTLWGFRFIYWIDKDAKGEYCTIFAYSYKQALHFWNKHYQAHGYEWELDSKIHPLQMHFKHKLGDMTMGFNV